MYADTFATGSRPIGHTSRQAGWLQLKRRQSFTKSSYSDMQRPNGSQQLVINKTFYRNFFACHHKS